MVEKKEIIIPRIIKSIDDLLANPEYLRKFSEQLETLFTPRPLTSSELKNISHRESMNSFTDVYREVLKNDTEHDKDVWDSWRIWKIRNKESYKDNTHRHSYEYDATILTWLKKHLAPVPTLLKYVQDLATKEQYNAEENKDIRKELEELGIDIKFPKKLPKEAMILVKLKEPRHDQDLVYLLTQVPEQDREKKLREEMSFALESVVSVDAIANYYLSEFSKNQAANLEGEQIRPYNPFKKDPSHHLTRIVESFERLAKLDILQALNAEYESRHEKGIREISANNSSTEDPNEPLKDLIQEKAKKQEKITNEPCLDEQLKELIKKRFSFVAEHTSKYLGFSQREAQPYHLARSEVPDWKGYHLFDFDKSGIDNIFLDPVMYLTNFITKLPYEKVQDLFLRGLVHWAKKISEMEEDKEFDTDQKLPIKSYKKYKKELRKFEIAREVDDPDYVKTEDAVKWLDRKNLEELVKIKDFTSLYTFLETIGRSAKSEYGTEFDRYTSTTKDNDDVEYHSSWLSQNGETSKFDMGKHYIGKPIREYCISSMHDILDRMIENTNPYYDLEEDEVNKLRDLRLFLRGLTFEYEGKSKKLRPFNIAPEKQEDI